MTIKKLVVNLNFKGKSDKRVLFTWQGELICYFLQTSQTSQTEKLGPGGFVFCFLGHADRAHEIDDDKDDDSDDAVDGEGDDENAKSWMSKRTPQK